MPKYNKSQAIFSYDVPGGALTANHAGIVSVGWGGERDNSESGTLGTNQVKNAYTGKDAFKGEIMVAMDNSANSAYQDFMTRFTDSTYVGLPFTIRIDAPDGAVGSDRIDQEIKLTSMADVTHDANSADEGQVKFGYTCDASFSHTTIT